MAQGERQCSESARPHLASPPGGEGESARPARGRGFSRKKEAFFWFVMAMLVVGGAEGALRIICWLSPQANAALSPRVPTIPDKLLGWRPARGYPEHDEKGFRNPRVPSRSDIVCIGDSQTYGYRVPYQDTWPVRLAARTGLSAYNLSFGGYGPTHSLVLLEEALKLNPKIVIEAIYAGNDLADCFQMVYVDGVFSEMKTSDTKILAEIEKKESVSRLREGFRHSLPTAAGYSRARVFLSAKSRLYGLGRALYRRFFPAKWEAPTIDNRWFHHFEKGSLNTILTYRQRLVGADLSDPRIAEGFRILLHTLDLLNERVIKGGARFLVVIIPTKELAFSKVAEERLAADDAFQKMVKSEEQIISGIRAHLRAMGVPVVDPLLDLRSELDKGRQPYGGGLDIHLNSLGCAALVEAIVHAVPDFAMEAVRR